MNLLSALFVLIIAFWNSPQGIFTQHVTNPKASVLDVAARQAFLKAASCPLLLAAKAALRSCLQLAPVPAPDGPMNIPHHYLSGSHGPVNPAEAIATKVYADFEERITAGMNQYVATGNLDEAKCALDQLDTWAKANALTDYDPNTNDNTQSWYQAEWTLASSGITMSVLVNEPSLDADKVDRVKQWLKSAAHKLLSFEKPGKVGNNHYYFRALAATSIGIVVSDDELYQHGVRVYKAAIGEIDQNGAFPLEMARHERATHYQVGPFPLFSGFLDLTPLIYLGLRSGAAHNHSGVRHPTRRRPLLLLGERPHLAGRH